MGLFAWIAILAAVVLVLGAFRLGAQAPPREPNRGPVALPPTPALVLRRTAAPSAYWDAARTVTKNALNSWLATAEVRGKVRGTSALVEGEWLVNTRFDLPGAIHGGLRQAGAPEDVASAIAQEVTEGWKTWIRGYRAANAAAFPSFAAVGTPVAPPSPSRVPVHALKQGESTADAAMGPGLAARIKSRLPNEPGAGPAAEAFAAWLSGRLKAWYSGAYLTDVKGGGPVPSYAPPYVPVGPVVGGVLTGHVASPTPF